MKNKGLIMGIVITIAIVVIVVAVGVCVVVINSNKGESTDKTVETSVTGKQSVDEEQSDDDDDDKGFLEDDKSYFIKIDGKKYYAGDKISDLKNAGYILRDSENDVDVPANKYMIGAGHMKTSDNKSSFDVTPYNITDSSVKVPDSVIGGFDISDFELRYNPKLSEIEVYGGIKLGSTEEELKDAFGEPSSVTDLDTSKTYYYESTDVYRDYKFTIKEGKVTSIEWQNLVFNE